MSKKRLPIFLVVIVCGFVAFMAWLILGSNNPNNQSTTNGQGQMVDANKLIIGNPNAPITIVEYADYKCPECGKFFAGVGADIRRDYVDTGKINIEFRPFPLFGQDGAKALAGSYCANEQGKFTQYHDALFSFMWNNYFKNGDYQKAIDPVLTDSTMTVLLQDIGMDKSAYDACLNSEKTMQLFEANSLQSANDEVQGTPTVIIGGEKIVGNQPYDVYKTLLDIQLQ